MSRFKGMYLSDVVRPWRDSENHCWKPGTPQDVIDIWEEVMEKDREISKRFDIDIISIPLK